jgi:integrase
MAKSLTVVAVRNARPGAKRKFIRDGDGRSLYFVIQPSGFKSWMMRFRRPNGKPGKLFLGPVRFDDVASGAPVIGTPLSLTAARRLAQMVLDERQQDRGRDHVAEQRAARYRQRAAVVERASNSFTTAARDYIDQHARPHVRRWREIARVLGLDYRNGEPTLVRGGLAQRWADFDVARIDVHHIRAAIDEATRSGIPGTVARVTGANDSRARVMARALSGMFTWLENNHRIAARPPVRIPRPPPARERVLDEAEIKAVWRAAERVNGQYGALIRLLLLSGCRLREISELRFDEIAPDGKTISLPGTRTKNRLPHLVPLAPMARLIIAAQPRVANCPYVFTTDGRRPIGFFSGWKKNLDALMPGVAPWRVHDLRRTVVTRMVEIGVQPHVVEMCVNHAGGHRAGVAGIYNRAVLMLERRRALERWARRVHAIVNGRRS